MTKSLEHIPCDMTATVDSGITLAALQTELAKGGQWLPIDPPFPEQRTVAEVLAKNLSGPRRFGYGTIRDYVIGMKVRLADGGVIQSGGKVVKNVAGYDLQKLFIGAEGSLGAIVEVTFKLRPLPESRVCLCKTCQSLAEAESSINGVLDSPLAPVILDLHSVNAASCCVVLGFDGTKEEIDWQSLHARELGFGENRETHYEKAFWETEPESIRKISVLPSKLIETIRQYSSGSFVARAGNGILFYHGTAPVTGSFLPVKLWHRTKAAFDPKNLLPSPPS